MNRAKRIALWLFFSVVFLAALSQLAVAVSNHRTKRRAESLLNSMRALKLGQSTMQEVQPILQSFNAQESGYDSGCPTADAAYSIRISNDAIGYLGLHVPVLRRAGIRPWGVVALLTVARGRLCSFLYGAAWVSNEPGAEKKVTTFMEPVGTATISHPNYRIDYYSSSHGLRGLRAILTPQSTEEETKRAFTYDLSCFATFHGCQLFCQIVPLVSKDAFERHQLEGLPAPAEEAGDPRCAPGR